MGYFDDNRLKGRLGLLIVVIKGLKLDIGVDVIKVDFKFLEELWNVVIRVEVVERCWINFFVL